MRRLPLPLLLLVALTAPCATGAPLAQVLRQFDSDSHADLRAVVVLREGALVAERYYNGQAQDGLHDMRSAGKSVTALLVGVAVARGQRCMGAGVHHAAHAIGPHLGHQQAVAVVQRLALSVKAQQLRAPGLHGCGHGSLPPM